jgi:nucleoside phosphorylase/tetratricopeptide (TPR) repeat protein
MGFINRSSEIKLFEETLKKVQANPTLLVIEGPLGIGKTSLLKKFNEIAILHAFTTIHVDATNIPLLKIVFEVVTQLQNYPSISRNSKQFKQRHSSLFQSTPPQSTNDPSPYTERNVLADFIKLIRRICLAERLILIFDGVHDWSESIFAKWLMGELLNDREITNLLVVAGTNSYRDVLLRNSPVTLKKIQLVPLSPEHARELVASLGVSDTQMASAIVDESEGLPLKIEMLATTHLDAGELKSGIDNDCELAGLIEKRRDSSEFHSIRPLLDAAAVLRSFDEETLLDLSQYDGKSPLERLDQTFKIRQLSLGRYALHDAVRMAFNSKLAISRPNYYRNLHLKAFHLIQKRIEWTTVASANWYSFVKEAIYHRSMALESKLPTDIIFHLDHCCDIYSYRFLLECVEELARNTDTRYCHWIEYYTAVASKNLYGSNSCEGSLNALCESISTPPAIRARAMNLLCEIEGESKGDWLSALRLAEASVEIGIVETKARSFELAGRACLALSRPFNAKDFFEKAIIEYDKRGDSRGSGLAWNFLGCVSSTLGKWKESEDYFLKASKCFEESSYTYGFCTVARDRGIYLLEKGEFDKAEAEMSLSEKLANDLDAPIASLLVAIKRKENMIRQVTLGISQTHQENLIGQLWEHIDRMRDFGCQLFEAIGIAALSELYFALQRKDELSQCLARISSLKTADPSLAPYLFSIRSFHSALVHSSDHEKVFWDSFTPDSGIDIRMPPMFLRIGLFAISSYFHRRAQHYQSLHDYHSFREKFLGSIPDFLTYTKPLLAEFLKKSRPASCIPLRLWNELTDTLVAHSRNDFLKNDAYLKSDRRAYLENSQVVQESAHELKNSINRFSVQSIEAKKIRSTIRLAILVATQVELLSVLSEMKPLTRRRSILKVSKNNDTFFLGKIGVVNTVVSLCSAGSNGPQGATLTANSTIEMWSPDAVLICGIAFGASRSQQREGDVLVATGIIPYENKRIGSKTIYRNPFAPCGPKLLNRFRNVIGWEFRRADNSLVQVHFGHILSGEKLVDDPSFKSSLLNDFEEAIGGEMEGTGLWAAATRHKKEWIVVKSVCDWADGCKNDEFHELAARASVSLCEYVFSSKGVLDGF